MQTIIPKHQPNPSRLDDVNDELLAALKAAKTPEDIKQALVGRKSGEIRDVCARLLFDDQYAIGTPLNIARISDSRAAQRLVISHVMHHEGWFREVLGEVRVMERRLDSAPAAKTVSKKG